MVAQPRAVEVEPFAVYQQVAADAMVLLVVRLAPRLLEARGAVVERVTEPGDVQFEFHRNMGTIGDRSGAEFVPGDQSCAADEAFGPAGERLVAFVGQPAHPEAPDPGSVAITEKVARAE